MMQGGGKTPLHWAAFYGQPRIVVLLLGCTRINPNAVDVRVVGDGVWLCARQFAPTGGRVPASCAQDRGETALATARAAGKADVIALLEEDPRVQR